MAKTNTTLTAEQAAINAALAAAYLEQAKVIARQKSAIDKAKEKIEQAQGSQWQAFKDAGRHGLELSHNTDTMAKGLTLACAELKVPQGTVNAYLPLIRKMYSAVTEGGEDAAAVFGLSVKDARVRFQPAKTKPAAPAATDVKTGNADAGAAGENAGDGDGMMGGNARSRLLSQIGEILGTLSDDDLIDLLATLTAEYNPHAAAA